MLHGGLQPRGSLELSLLSVPILGVDKLKQASFGFFKYVCILGSVECNYVEVAWEGRLVCVFLVP